MHSAVRAGSEAIAKARTSGMLSAKKEVRELVTSCDLASEQAITEVIMKDYPHSSILSEEMGAIEGTEDLQWLIDPLDGTHNFFYGLADWGISIAALCGGEVVAGIVFLPVWDKTFHAVLNGGAFENGRPIRVAHRNLEESLVFYDNQFTKDPMMYKNLPAIYNSVFTVRIGGSAACDLTRIANGTIDARIFHKTKAVDVAAGRLLVKEAGGAVTNFSGGPISVDTTDVIASNGVIHRELISLLSQNDTSD